MGIENGHKKIEIETERDGVTGRHRDMPEKWRQGQT